MKRIGFLLLLASGPAAAHGGETHEGIPGWSLDPWVIVPLALLLIVYLVGRKRLADRSDVKRGGLWRFLGGWTVLTLALISPLHEGGEHSFTLHMIEHELIMLVATLLLAASSAGGALAWGLPRPLRLSLGGTWKAPLAAAWKQLTEPVTATVLQAIALWAWHAPALFDRALDHPGWHIAQHMSFLLTSLFFWTAMLNPRRGSNYGTSAMCLFLTSLVGGALGALMAFSSSPWYAGYAAMGVSGIGLDLVTDQQLAGLVMWIPGGLVHAGAALILLNRWLKTAGSGDAVSLP
jgi:cytochrome c oxidase assembly factor CtaG